MDDLDAFRPAAIRAIERGLNEPTRLPGTQGGAFPSAHQRVELGTAALGRDWRRNLSDPCSINQNSWRHRAGSPLHLLLQWIRGGFAK
jgi:hypothetical protein